MQWLKDLHWSLYYETGLTFLPKPEPREWHIMLLDGMEQPFPRAGYVQVITRMPSGLCDAGYHHAPAACPVHQPRDVHPMYAARQTMNQMDARLADQYLRDLFR